MRVPKLGGVDYRLGPGAQVPLGPSAVVEALNLGGTAPTSLAIELVQMIQSRKYNYFGRVCNDVPPPVSSVKQEKMSQDFFASSMSGYNGTGSPHYE